MKNKFVLVTLLFFVACPALGKRLDATNSAEKPDLKPLPKISIVIDDLGDNSIIARQMLSLPATMTAAILPRTPHAKPIAEFAAAHGHEVIMHLPMEAFSRPDLLGPGALLADMPKQAMQQTLEENAATVPNMVGFNNHMGSLLTENEEKMRWVMEAAKAKGWYFLDSKTTEASVAQNVAGDIGIPTIGRDVFLDHHTDKDESSLRELFAHRFEQALKIARIRGQVVIICHPYPETLQFLQDRLPLINQEYQMVRLSRLFSKQENSQNLTQFSK